MTARSSLTRAVASLSEQVRDAQLGILPAATVRARILATGALPQASRDYLLAQLAQAPHRCPEASFTPGKGWRVECPVCG